MNRIVVITGASSGIGLKTAELFKNKGDKVINISKSSSDIGDENYLADISNEEEVSRVFEEIKRDYGRIDVLINNAGYGMSGVTELLTSSECEQIFKVNYFGTLNCIKKALPIMGNGSKIINLGSAMALFPIPFRAMYGASKAAVVNLSYSLRMELKPLGIDVCVICPGNTKTNFTKNRVKEFATNERYGDRITVATEKIDKNDSKRMLPDCVARAIVKQTYKKRSKPMVIVGGKYKLLYLISKITPKSWLLNVTEKLYNGIKN